MKMRKPYMDPQSGIEIRTLQQRSYYFENGMKQQRSDGNVIWVDTEIDFGGPSNSFYCLCHMKRLLTQLFPM